MTWRLCGFVHDIRRYACLGLGNLLAVSSNHKAMLEAGLVEALRESLMVEDMETR